MGNKDFVIKNGILTKYRGIASNVIIPDGVTAIDINAFAVCKGLANITIPNSVTCIDDGAFRCCVNLQSVNIPNSVKIIGNFAFEYCCSLTSITIPDSVTSIGYYAFTDCTSLKSINIPNSVTSIGDSAFALCENITSIDIPSSITNIANHAFYGCKGLANITIPNSVTSIEFGAFYGIKPIKRPQLTDGKITAYKVFNKDWSCRGFHYEVGKTYRQDGVIKCCENGFHACPNPLDVFYYYYGNLDKLRFAEVELSGTLDWEYNKVAASDIKIVRELTATELAEIYNKMEKE